MTVRELPQLPDEYPEPAQPAVDPLVDQLIRGVRDAQVFLSTDKRLGEDGVMFVAGFLYAELRGHRPGN